MKKALIVASVASMIDQFNMSNIIILKKIGYEVHVAANFNEAGTITSKRTNKLINELNEKNVKIHNLEFDRNPMKYSNFIVLKKMISLFQIQNYTLIHCHSPIGGLLTRLAVRKYKGIIKPYILYTAHGFHFFKGSPLKNWLIYFPIEYFMSFYTNTLITINREDYLRAKKFKAQSVEYIPGTGVYLDKIDKQVVNQKEKRQDLGIPLDAFLICSVGELNSNKNHETIIKAINKLENKNIYYVICGKGNLEYYLINLINNLNLGSNIKILGYREDVIDILRISDLFTFPSKREGLGISALEAMACGLPIVTSNVHGIIDYSINGKTGYSCNPMDVEGFSKAINCLYEDEKLRNLIGENNIKIAKEFSIDKTNKKMYEIYKSL